MKDLRRTFKPEFLNRIDDIIVFSQLSKADIRKIAANMMKVVKERVAGMGIGLEVEDGALDLLAERGFDPVYGARPLRRRSSLPWRTVWPSRCWKAKSRRGDTALVSAKDGKILIEPKSKAAESIAQPDEKAGRRGSIKRSGDEACFISR